MVERKVVQQTALVIINPYRAVVSTMLAVGLLASAAQAADAPQAQGVVRGMDEALLSPEMAGTILRIKDEGESFREGDVLVEFSCDIQRAEEDIARALEQAARARLENQKRLEAAKSAGQLDLALAQALLAEALAKVRAAVAKTRLCKVTAPYNGTILKREARPHESVNIMAPLLKVARGGAMEVTVIAPASWLPWLKIGTPFTFTAAATGQKVEGKVFLLGGAVDSSSQTVEVRGELAIQVGAGLKSGMAGSVTFPRPSGGGG